MQLAEKSDGLQTLQGLGKNGFDVFPCPTSLEAVKTLVTNYLSVLHLTHREPRPDSGGNAESQDRVPSWGQALEFSLSSLGNYTAAREFIGLAFSLVLKCFLVVNERFRVVQQQMTDLVKYRKPKLIVCSKPETKQDHSLVRSYEPSCAAGAAVLRRSLYHNCHAGLGAKILQLWDETSGLTDF